MNELLKVLIGWKERARKIDKAFNPPKPSKPKQQPKRQLKATYPAGMSEEEKLKLARERIRRQRQEQQPQKPKKPWWKRGIYDLF